MKETWQTSPVSKLTEMTGRSAGKYFASTLFPSRYGWDGLNSVSEHRHDPVTHNKFNL